MSRILLVFTSTTHALTLTSECFSTMSLSCVKSSSRYWKIMTKAFITKWMCVKIISLAIGVHVNPSCRQSYLKPVPSEFFSLCSIYGCNIHTGQRLLWRISCDLHYVIILCIMFSSHLSWSLWNCFLPWVNSMFGDSYSVISLEHQHN